MPAVMCHNTPIGRNLDERVGTLRRDDGVIRAENV